MLVPPICFMSDAIKDLESDISLRPQLVVVLVYA